MDAGSNPPTSAPAAGTLMQVKTIGEFARRNQHVRHKPSVRSFPDKNLIRHKPRQSVGLEGGAEGVFGIVFADPVQEFLPPGLAFALVGQEKGVEDASFGLFDVAEAKREL